MKRGTLLLLLFVALKFVIQYQSIHPVYELHRDEFLHLDLASHLAWGYITVPPITGLIAYIIELLGNSVFWVKFFPALFGAGIIVVCWKIVDEFGGGLFAKSLTSIGLIFSALLRLNTLFQPNSLDYFCWTLVFYAIIKFVKTSERRWLYYTALAFALGFLNKYNIVFLLIGILPALLLSEHRDVFRRKDLYLAALVGIALILPNVIWQIANDFPVIWHMQTLASQQLVNVNRADFLTEQIFFFTGSLLIILFGFVAPFVYTPLKPFRFLVYTFIITMGVFTYLRAKNYYAIGLYPVFIGMGAVYLESLLSKPAWKLARIPVLLLPILTFIPMYPLILPILSPSEILEKKEMFDKLELTRWEDGQLYDLPQDFADMLGWKELASLVDSAYTMVDEPQFTLVHCDNYGEAGAINFYGKPYHQALTLSADYMNWYPLDEFEFKNIILINTINDEDPERSREKEFFEEVILIGEITHPNARERGTRVHLLRGAKTSINEILREEIASRSLR